MALNVQLCMICRFGIDLCCGDLLFFCMVSVPSLSQWLLTLFSSQMWYEIMNTIESACEGIFQWAEDTLSDSSTLKSVAKNAMDICSNLLLNILRRLLSELECQGRFLVDANSKKKIRNAAALKRVLRRRRKLSQESIYKYLKLVHRLRAFSFTNDIMKTVVDSSKSGDANGNVMFGFILMSIFTNDWYFLAQRHSIVALAVRTLCEILPMCDESALCVLIQSLRFGSVL